MKTKRKEKKARWKNALKFFHSHKSTEIGMKISKITIFFLLSFVQLNDIVTHYDVAQLIDCYPKWRDQCNQCFFKRPAFKNQLIDYLHHEKKATNKIYDSKQWKNLFQLIPFGMMDRVEV